MFGVKNAKNELAQHYEILVYFVALRYSTCGNSYSKKKLKKPYVANVAVR